MGGMFTPQSHKKDELKGEQAPLSFNKEVEWLVNEKRKLREQVEYDISELKESARASGLRAEDIDWFYEETASMLEEEPVINGKRLDIMMCLLITKSNDLTQCEPWSFMYMVRPIWQAA